MQLHLFSFAVVIIVSSNRQKHSIPKCNTPIKSLYIFTYFVVLLHSAMLIQKTHLVFPHTTGIHYTVGVDPARISAVTFQIEMLTRAYYHRECFPGENYPEH